MKNSNFYSALSLCRLSHNFQTLQEGLSGAAFHPLDDNLLITHGRGHLAFWHRRKDGFFEKTDIIKQVIIIKLCFSFMVGWCVCGW